MTPEQSAGQTSDRTPLGNAVRAARRYARPLRRGARRLKDRNAERHDPTRAWLGQASRRLPVTADTWDGIEENRRRLIQQLAPGKSFLDVGGMYRVAGEMSFLAEEYGATRVTLFDITDPSDEFAQKHSARSSNVEFIQADLHDPSAVADLGQFDIVWCTGVIYHTPHPMQQLLYLRRLAKETLVLGTHVIPELPGFDQACILYPGISEEQQATYARFHGVGQFPGMTSPFDTTWGAYANMWWGISVSALRSMLHYTGFDVSEEYLYTPIWTDVVARVGGMSTDIYSAFDQPTGRVLARYDGVPDAAVPQWAQRQTRALRAGRD